MTTLSQTYTRAGGKAFDLMDLGRSAPIVASFPGAMPAARLPGGLTTDLAGLTTEAAWDAPEPSAQSSEAQPAQPNPPEARKPAIATVEEGPVPSTDSRETAEARRVQRNLSRMEVMFQLLNIGDMATTLVCVHRVDCKESNPLYGGNHPSQARIIGIKAGVGLLHYLAYRTLSKADPRLAKIFEFSSIAIQGSVVLWNLTVVIK